MAYVPVSPLDDLSAAASTPTIGLEWTIVGTIASVIAAVGVIIQLWLWLHERPTVELQFAPVRETTLESFVMIRNVGLAPALGIAARGVHCRVTNLSPSLTSEAFAAGSHGAVTLESVTGGSYLVVSWNHPNRKRRTQMTWTPVRDETELVAEHDRQVRRSALGRMYAALRFRHYAGPGGRLFVSMPRDRRKLERILAKARRRKPPARTE